MKQIVGVALKENMSASEIFYEVLSKAVSQFDCWQDLTWPTLNVFKKSYVDLLPEFEARRLASPRRAEIAQFLAAEIQAYLSLDGLPLGQYLGERQSVCEIPKLNTVVGKKAGGWQPEFEYQARAYSDFSALAETLFNNRVISRAAQDSLDWLQSHHLSQGALDLSGRKVCVMGAAAEMAATRYFLQAGAQVLWIDRVAPDQELLGGEGYSGTLCYPETNADLLNDPAGVLALIRDFAAGEPADLCLYAYAPGQARELRLTGVMNAIVNVLPRELIASVTILVSPTTPAALHADDLKQMAERLNSRPGWEAALEKIGLLGRGGGSARSGNAATIRSLVSIQGASYQAAQYLGKLMMAEAWVSYGLPASDGGLPLRVSANTAAITQTRSLDHPVFDAAFGGAAALQVETFTPVQSQSLNGLLAISDWLQDDLPTPGAVRIHGGIHTLPYPLEAALKPAAGIGFARSPGLLLGLLKGNK